MNWREYALGQAANMDGDQRDCSRSVDWLEGWDSQQEEKIEDQEREMLEEERNRNQQQDDRERWAKENL